MECKKRLKRLFSGSLPLGSAGNLHLTFAFNHEGQAPSCRSTFCKSISFFLLTLALSDCMIRRGCFHRLDGTLEIKDEGVRRGMEDVVVATLTAMLEWRKHNNKVSPMQMKISSFSGEVVTLKDLFRIRLGSGWPTSS